MQDKTSLGVQLTGGGEMRTPDTGGKNPSSPKGGDPKKKKSFFRIMQNAEGEGKDTERGGL